MRNYKNYFFHTKICFDNNFYLFLSQNLNNFVSFKTRVVERWLIQMKGPVAAPTLLVLSHDLFTTESTNAHIEVVWKVANYIGMTVF